MANPTSRGQQRDKPFRDAIRMEANLAENGEETPAKPGSLRFIARALLNRAGSDTAAAREIGDRLDGKPAQALEHSGALALTHEEALSELDDTARADDTSESED